MKKTLSVVLFACLLSACEPVDRTPGMWLSGELVTAEITDWTFSNEQREVFLQTHPWYGIPFSITVVAATTGDKLFMPSIYSEPAAFPEGKYWNGIVARNPEVLIRIGGKLYPRSVHLIVDEDEFEEAFSALANKYDYWKAVKEGEVERPPFVLLRLDPSEK